MRISSVNRPMGGLSTVYQPNYLPHSAQWGNTSSITKFGSCLKQPASNKRKLPLLMLVMSLLTPALGLSDTMPKPPAQPSTTKASLDPAQQVQLNTLNQQLQQKSIQYFIDQRHPGSGLILDRSFTEPLDKPHPKARMASIAATGYGLSAWVLGAASGKISHKDARAWTQQVLDTVEKITLPEQKGWLAHFIDVETGKPYQGSEISSVDTALFYMGALTAGQYFGGDIQKQVQRMFDQVDFPFMLTQNGKFPDSQTFSHGFYLDDGDPRPRFIPHQWDHFAEGIMLPLLALGSTTHPVSDDVWTKGWKRGPEWIYNNYTTLGPLPLFTHYYPLGYFNLKGKHDNQGLNPWELAEQAVLAQIDYCRDNGYPYGLFGLSACDGPNGYRAYQPEDQHANQNDKTLALPAMAASLPWAPDAVFNGLNTAKAKGWLDTRYGLLCSVDPVSGWKSSDALGIDIGSTLLMLDASLNQRVHALTDQHPVIKRGLQRAGFAP